MNAWDRSKDMAEDEPKEESDRAVHSACGTVSILDDHDASELYCAHCQSRFPASEFSWQ